MEPRDQRDHLDLGRVEPAQVAVPDQVVRMLRVPVVTHRGADVVEQRPVLEQLALRIAQAVLARQAVEQLEGEPRDVARVAQVALLGLELLQQLEDAPHAQVLDADHRRDLAGVRAHVVRHQPLAHAEVRDHDPRGLELLEDVREHQPPREQDLGPHRVETLERFALGERHPANPMDQAVQALGGEHVAVELLERLSRLLEVRELRQRVDRARGTVDPLRPQLANRREGFVGLPADRPLQAPELRSRRRIRVEVRLGEPQGAERGGQDDPQRVTVSDHELHAPAADVEDQAGMLVQCHGRANGEVDEAPLLLGRNHARVDPRAAPGFLDELAAVPGLAHRGRRGAQDAVHVHAARELAEALEGLDRAPHRRALQHAGPERPAADLGDLALAVHDLEAPAFGGAGDDHVDRVRADVDGGDAHAYPSPGSAASREYRPSRRGDQTVCGAEVERIAGATRLNQWLLVGTEVKRIAGATRLKPRIRDAETRPHAEASAEVAQNIGAERVNGTGFDFFSRRSDLFT